MGIALPTIACLLGVLASAEALAACGSSPTLDIKCTVVSECRKAFDEFRKMHANNPHMADELLRITCGFENNVPKICCPLESHHENLSITTNGEEPAVAGVPKPAHCGNINFDRILTAPGTPTELEQYDWLALLEYETPTGGKQAGCGGALISDRYVLTAAHCVEPWRRLTGVRLGEYDLRTASDCIYDAEQRYCNNKTTSFGVEEVIPHEKYAQSVGAADRLYDIALLRLSVSVAPPFDNPICLPGEQQPTPAKSYTTAGWGVGPSAKPATQVKRFAQLKHLDGDACADKLGRQAVERDAVCTSAQNNFLGCLADSGGPLMAFDKQARFTLVGVSALANGATCSQTSDSINVYTDVNQYVDWIYGRMR